MFGIDTELNYFEKILEHELPILEYNKLNKQKQIDRFSFIVGSNDNHIILSSYDEYSKRKQLKPENKETVNLFQSQNNGKTVNKLTTDIAEVKKNSNEDINNRTLNSISHKVTENISTYLKGKNGSFVLSSKNDRCSNPPFSLMTHWYLMVLSSACLMLELCHNRGAKKPRARSSMYWLMWMPRTGSAATRSAR
jgi:predicted transcriptional regulator